MKASPPEPQPEPEDPYKLKGEPLPKDPARESRPPVKRNDKAWIRYVKGCRGCR